MNSEDVEGPKNAKSLEIQNIEEPKNSLKGIEV